jgi:hypothetical protein
MCVVYFVAAGNPPEAIKIGRSCDVTLRVGSIQTGNHLPVRLLGVVPGGLDLERALHRRFAHLQLQGEWFRWDDEIARVVADVPFSGLAPDDAFVGVLGEGLPRSFYRAFVRDRSGQWWRFELRVEMLNYDPDERQRRIGALGHAAETFRGRLADAAHFDGHPDNPALLRVLARARELAA